MLREGARVSETLRFRSRDEIEKENKAVQAIENHPELGPRAAEGLKYSYSTGDGTLVGLSPHQVVLMRTIAADYGVPIPTSKERKKGGAQKRGLPE